MTPIITPALVRRYLIATGQVPEELRVFDALVTGEEALDGFLQDFEIDCPALGMLAAAEMDLEVVRSGIRDYAATLELAAYAKVRRAGVDPEAWEKARGSMSSPRAKAAKQRSVEKVNRELRAAWEAMVRRQIALYGGTLEQRGDAYVVKAPPETAPILIALMRITNPKVIVEVS